MSSLMTGVLSELKSENQRLENELIFINKCLNVLFKFKTHLMEILNLMSSSERICLTSEDIQLFKDIDEEYNKVLTEKEIKSELNEDLFESENKEPIDYNIDIHSDFQQMINKNVSPIISIKEELTQISNQMNDNNCDTLLIKSENEKTIRISSVKSCETSHRLDINSNQQNVCNISNESNECNSLNLKLAISEEPFTRWKRRIQQRQGVRQGVRQSSFRGRSHIKHGITDYENPEYLSDDSDSDYTGDSEWADTSSDLSSEETEDSEWEACGPSTPRARRRNASSVSEDDKEESGDGIERPKRHMTSTKQVKKMKEQIKRQQLIRSSTRKRRRSGSDSDASVEVREKKKKRKSESSLRIKTWKQYCLELLNYILEREDSTPFRSPVDPIQYPDYSQVIDTPMDLTTVKKQLISDLYDNPSEFCKDMRLIFANSKSYNTNKKSRIYSMTVRLSGYFEEKIAKTFKFSEYKTLVWPPQWPPLPSPPVTNKRL